jgi:ATP-dependent Clp protease protease subunit
MAMTMATKTKEHLLLLEDVEKCEREIIAGLLALPDGGHATIVINSGGGSVYAGLGIGTVIRHKRLHCHAIVLADCSSSALLVFAACETREIAPHASFLFHPMQWSSDDRSRVNGAKSWSEEFTRVCASSEEWMSELLPIPMTTLRRWVNQERYVKAHELIDRGIASPLALPGPKVVSVPRPAARRATKTTASRSSAKIRRVG